MDRYQQALYHYALQYYISIVEDRFGGQVPQKFVKEEAQKMLDRDTEEFMLGIGGNGYANHS